ncbi:glycoside hydrolase N-terminal domain-containing protein [Microbacterium neimengense]
MSADTLQLSWPAPARLWEEATPLGNGRIGVMAFGGGAARFAINDATVWSGSPQGPSVALGEVLAGGAGPVRLAQVRDLLERGEVREAERLLLTFEGAYSQEFLPFAELVLTSEGRTESIVPARVLDLDDAVLSEQLRVDGIDVTRRSWVSAPAQALVVEIVADAPVTMTVSLATALVERARSITTEGIGLEVVVPVDGPPLHEPDLPAHRYPNVGDAWDGAAAIETAVRTDGAVTAGDAQLRIVGARRILITLSTASRAASWWAGTGEERRISTEEIRDRARELARDAVVREVRDVLSEHVLDRRALSRARFAIGDVREGRWDAEDLLRDPQLAATMMAEYGRYLLCSASRAGAPAANLQGIWNAEARPAWSSNYTININTQMNYWAAGLLGLDDPAEPLISMVERLASHGADVARELYGARGWVAHHNSDLWGWALPVGRGRGAASWAIWMMGGVWLCHSLWELWATSGDDDLLRTRILPLMRGSAEFCLDWLVADADGALRTSPSTSPENSFVGPDGAPTPLGLSATSDLSLIGALLQRTEDALAVVDPADPLRAEIRAALPRLLPVEIDADGRVREWAGEVVENEPAHRHLSHLVGLYPLDTITPEATPRLAQAARRSLEARGPGAMGWSWAWKTALRARLGDGEHAAELLGEAFQPYRGDVRRHGPVDGSEWGGLLPNLFSTHPPFQIDGNLGFPAAIAEMLVQSHTGQIHLLPALPAAWDRGSVRGLRLRGGVEIDLAWRESRPVGVRLRCVRAVDVVVRHGDIRVSVALPAGVGVEVDAALFLRSEAIDAR